MQNASDYRSATIAALGLALIAGASVISARHVPDAIATHPSADMFSAEQALNHVRAIATRPHPGGTPEHAHVREYLLNALRTLGVEGTVQEATGLGMHNSVAGRVANVVARLPGQRPGGPSLLLAAHYDGVPGGPAAADDGAGVAVLLEAIRALRNGPPIAHDIIVLFSDGEEAGLTGAAAFVQAHAWAGDVGATLNFDSGGVSGPTVVLQTGNGNSDLIRHLRNVPAVGGSSILTALFGFLPYDTDVSELSRLGTAAMTLGFAGSSRYYHTAVDDVEHLDRRSLQNQGDLAVRLARSIADGPLPLRRTTSSVFFKVPTLGLIAYSERAVLPLACVAAFVVVLACIGLRKTTRRWPIELALGFASAIITTVLAIGTAAAAGVLLDRLFEPTYLMGWAEARNESAIGIALIALSVVAVCWQFTRRWISPRGAHLGGLIVWLILALLTSWGLRGASFLFTIPLLSAAIAALVALVSKDDRARAIASWATAVIVLTIVTPAIYDLAVVPGMGLPGAVAVGLFVPLTAWILAPQLELLTVRGQRKSAIAFAACGLLIVGLGLARSRSENPRLVHSMLAYAVDAESGHAWVVSPARLARTKSWAASALGPSRIVSASNPQPAADSAAPSWLRRAIAGEAPTLAASAPRHVVGMPTVAVAADSSDGHNRRLKVHIQPASGTYSLRLRIPISRIDSVRFDDHMIDRAPFRGPTYWSFGYVLPPDDGFDLTLLVKGSEPVEVEVIARSLGLPAAIAAAIPPRSAGVVPVHAGDQTVVRRLSRL